MAGLVARSTIFAQPGKGGHGSLSLRSRVTLNEVKDPMLGFALHKLNRLTHDRGRGPLASPGMTQAAANGNLNAPCLWIGLKFLPKRGKADAVA